MIRHLHHQTLYHCIPDLHWHCIPDLHHQTFQTCFSFYYIFIPSVFHVGTQGVNVGFPGSLSFRHWPDLGWFRFRKVSATCVLSHILQLSFNPGSWYGIGEISVVKTACEWGGLTHTPSQCSGALVQPMWWESENHWSRQCFDFLLEIIYFWLSSTVDKKLGIN